MQTLRAKSLSVCLATLLFGISVMRAQTNPSESGTITGTVLDVSGKPIPGAGVTVRSESSGQPRNLISDAEGKFSVSGLPTELRIADRGLHGVA